jgi:hypothetical protein
MYSSLQQWGMCRSLEKLQPSTRTAGTRGNPAVRQKELASQAATAPLQQQIDDLNKLVSDQQNQIGKLQRQAQLDAAAALDAQSSAHERGLRRGLALGVAVTAFFLLAIFLIKRLTSTFSITRRSPQESEAR